MPPRVKRKRIKDGWSARMAAAGDRMPGRWMARRSEALANATTRPGGPGKSMSYGSSGTRPREK